MARGDSSSARESDDEEERRIRQQLSEGNPSLGPLRRLKPRLGSQYQTKVPKHGSQTMSSDRPLPELMSSEEPFLAENEINRGVRGSHESIVPPVSNDHCDGQGYDPPMGESAVTKRGGLCVHRSSRTHDGTADEFMQFCQRLMLPPRSDSNNLGSTNESWAQEMISQYGTSQSSRRRGGGSNSSKRGRKATKRKRSEESEPDISPQTMTDSVQSSRSERPFAHSDNKTDPFGELRAVEDIPHMLEYLHWRHQGNVEEAQYSVLVDLSAGRATKARRCLRKHLHSERFKRPPVASSGSWRTRFERTFPEMLGDLRSDNSRPSPYAHCWSQSTNESTVTVESGSASLPSFSDNLDDIKGVWRSVLAYGQAMENTMSTGSGKPNRPSVSEAISFLQNSYTLPTPEDAFGTRHIVIEQISLCFISILDHISKARDVQAKLMDKIHDQEGEGIDLDVLKRALDEADRTLPVRLDESSLLFQHLDIARDWQERLDALLGDGECRKAAVDSSGNVTSDTLAAAESLILEARGHCLRSRNLVALQKKVERTYQLRDRIVQWSQSLQSGKQETIKVIASMVKEANRVELVFPEMSSLLNLHQTVESWVDRANIAIRSRMSLSEVESLIEKAGTMPVDLSEYMDKLRSRVRMAFEWISEFEKQIPRLTESDGSSRAVASAENKLECLKRMREALHREQKGKHSSLAEIAAEGSRVPVDIEYVTMLQIEIDSKHWSAKVKKWIPRVEESSANGGSVSSKKGKLSELREHASKGAAIRERLVFCSAEDREKWILDGEKELLAIVDSADDWLSKYQPYLEGDNRKNQARSCIAMSELKNIVIEAQKIHAHIGTAHTKIIRIHGQANDWYEEHFELLLRCGICSGKETASETEIDRSKPITLSEMSSAVSNAKSSIPLDLEEAIELENIVGRVERWFERTLQAAPKRSKRTVRGKPKHKRFCLADVIALIDDAGALPVDTAQEVDRLKVQLNAVQTWRLQAHFELEEIAAAFGKLREAINAAYGIPDEFLVEKVANGDGVSSFDGDASISGIEQESESLDCSQDPDSGVAASEEMSTSDTASCESSETDGSVRRRFNGKSGVRVDKLVDRMLKNARATGVNTNEENYAEFLQRITKWCTRSLAYMNSPKKVLEKKQFSPFNMFVASGEQLVSLRDDDDANLDLRLDSKELTRNLKSMWGSLISDQLVRLKAVQSHRDKFIQWSDAAENILSASEKKIPLETLLELYAQCDGYPSGTEMVQRIKNLFNKATTWRETANSALKAETKLSMQQAKDLFNDGDKLNICCQELKALKAAIRAARSWSARVKKCKVDQGGAEIRDVQELIDEHDSLLIAMPDVVNRLDQALRGYCICRRPYEGFMIGCDECEEWYHGPCIGVSEAQANRVDKFTCVRCCVVKVFRASAASTMSIIRKWVCDKDLKKARQVDWQKHQRRVRKEKKDIEKLEPEIERLEKILLEKGSGSSGTIVVAVAGAGESVAGHNAEKCDGEPSVRFQGVTKDNGKLHTHTKDSSRGTLESDFSCNHPSQDNVNVTQVSTSRQLLQPGSIKDSVNSDFSQKDTEVLEKLGKAKAALSLCRNRLEGLAQQAMDLKGRQQEEDEKGHILRRWCLTLSSSVLFPPSAEQARESLPPKDGSLSVPMRSVIAEAEALGICHLGDVASVINAFGCISWSFRSLSVLSRKPTIDEMKALVTMTASLKLPEEKASKMIKSMTQRANSWRARVSKALAPKPGESAPCCVDTLKSLAAGAEDIPVILPEEARLQSAIEDNGTRHCFCGGPNDGDFMLGCDKCDRWYHGRCVSVFKDGDHDVNKWVCPSCSGAPIPDFFSHNSDSVSLVAAEDERSPYAPNPDDLWPPYGFLDSQKASDALGEHCVKSIQLFNDRGGWNSVAKVAPKVALPVVEPPINQNGNGPFIVSPELQSSSMDVDALPKEDADSLSSAKSAELVVKIEDATTVEACDVNGTVIHTVGRPDSQQKTSDYVGQGDANPQTLPATKSLSEKDNIPPQKYEGMTRECPTNISNIDSNNSLPVSVQLASNPTLPGAYLGTIIEGDSLPATLDEKNSAPVSAVGIQSPNSNAGIPVVDSLVAGGVGASSVVVPSEP